MRNLISILSVIVPILILCQEPKDHPLEFRVSAEKTTYRVYEPLKLKLEVTNRGEQPVEGIFGCLALDRLQLRLFYRRKGGEFKRYYSLRVSMARGRDYGAAVELLKPGRQVSQWETVLFDTLPDSDHEDRFVFDESGEYEFKATFQYIQNDPSKMIESNVLSVTVVAPLDDERDALTLWKDEDLASAIQDHTFDLETTRKVLTFLEKFPNSFYATHVQGTFQQFLADLEKRAKQGRLTEREEKLYELARPRK